MLLFLLARDGGRREAMVGLSTLQVRFGSRGCLFAFVKLIKFCEWHSFSYFSPSLLACALPD
jgi:hypothetical protein